MFQSQAYIITSIVVVDLALVKRDVCIVVDGNSRSLPNEASNRSFLGNFLDRGAFEESTRKVQESKHIHIQLCCGGSHTCQT